MADAARKISALKAPPHSIEAEQALLGGVMYHEGAVRDIEIQPEDFYRKEHRLIWKACQELIEARKSVDVITVAEQLRNTSKLEDAGGIDYLSDLISVPSARGSMQTYANAVKGKAKERALCSLGHQIADIGYSAGDSQEKVNDAEAAIGAFMRRLESGEAEEVALPPIIKDRLKALEYRCDHPGELMGKATGFADLDSRLSGIVNADLIIVAARPSMGKTTFALNIAENFALRGEPVVVFSLEMPQQKLVDRMLCSLGKVDNGRFRRGELTDSDWDSLGRATKLMREMPMYIDGNRRLTSDQLVSRAKRIAYRHGFPKPGLVVLDYMQLMVDQGEGQERVSRISRNLKLAGEELDCPMIVLSQLNRGLEQRPNKRPILSDLRDSGAIEQDADAVIMLYRDIVYNPNTEAKGVAEVLIRKARDSEISEFRIADNLHRCRFDNLAQSHRPPPPASHAGSADMFQY